MWSIVVLFCIKGHTITFFGSQMDEKLKNVVLIIKIIYLFKKYDKNLVKSIVFNGGQIQGSRADEKNKLDCFPTP